MKNSFFRDLFNKKSDVVEEAKDPSQIFKALKIIVIVIIAIVVISGGFYNVSEQENAVVTMFGSVVRTDTAGLYFKIPLIQKVHYVDITTHGTGVGYSIDNNGQNITDETNGIMITSDFNLLDIDFYLEYRVSDPVAYLYASDNPEEILKNIALSSIRSVVADFTVDEAMTTAKGQIQSIVKEDMTRELNEHDIGLAVVNITVQDSEPPTNEIKQAFKAVETAKQGADTAKNNALAYQNEQLPRAEANADKIIQSAEADKAARIAEAEGQVVRFNEMYEQYKQYPYITKKRMFYETMEELLPSLKVIISDGGTQTLMPLDSFNKTEESAPVQESAVTGEEGEEE
ncbi:MAG: FtsH protease activity modulator HflK [Lachnospiraceae bacterium]|nr:FtsH protease activity modulator HflK [Lachnospiraceae bacterium]